MVTPAAFVSVYPFSSPAFALRAFAKKSFRMPTFNELYYTEVGNASLKPETAIQYNLGFVLSTDSGPSWLGSLSLQADGYYNTVHDKVVAYPKGQQFRWTMLNLGRVHIAGVAGSGRHPAGAPSGPVCPFAVHIPASARRHFAIAVILRRPDSIYTKAQRVGHNSLELQGVRL